MNGMLFNCDVEHLFCSASAIYGYLTFAKNAPVDRLDHRGRNVNIYNKFLSYDKSPAKMFWQAILLLLDFSFPKSVEVAVSINCNRFIFAGAKGRFR